MIARQKLGMGLFLSSESLFFFLLILAYVYYRAAPANLADATPKSSLDVARTAIFTLCLLSSSLTIWLAGRSLRKGNHGQLRLWLLVTLGLGTAFLIGQGKEYSDLFAKQVTISRDVFGSAFFTLTGFHGFHVFIGLIALLILLGLAQGGDFRDGKGLLAFETISWYWHFVDAVWVVIFTVVYLWTAVS